MPCWIATAASCRPPSRNSPRCPGVVRKTANVMFAHWFGKPAVVVDTHFRRVATRLGLTDATDPDRVEAQIRALIPEPPPERAVRGGELPRPPLLQRTAARPASAAWSPTCAPTSSKLPLAKAGEQDAQSHHFTWQYTMTVPRATLSAQLKDGQRPAHPAAGDGRARRAAARARRPDASWKRRARPTSTPSPAAPNAACMCPVDYGIAPGLGARPLGAVRLRSAALPDRARVSWRRSASAIRSTAATWRARLNFATRDAAGAVTDRRAPDASPPSCARGLAARLDSIELPGVEVAVRPVRDYPGRAGAARRRSQRPGVRHRSAAHRRCRAARRAPASRRPSTPRRSRRRSWTGRANCWPARRRPTRCCCAVSRQLPEIPSLAERFGLRPVALAVYPDYKGVSRLVGMEAIDGLADLDAQEPGRWPRPGPITTTSSSITSTTDSAGEDGDFDAKVAEVEKVDRALPALLAGAPEVVIVTGDHSTPSVARSHTAHPGAVPDPRRRRAARRGVRIRRAGRARPAPGAWCRAGR